MTKPMKYVLSGPCYDAQRGRDVPGHGACYGEYGEVKTLSGDLLPPQRCPCECHQWPDEGVPA